VTLLPDGRIQVAATGDPITYSRARPYLPTPAELSLVVGRYRSAEAGADYAVSLEKDSLQLTVADRPDATFLLKPAYLDAFTYSAGIVRLVRGADGGVTALRLSGDRVWDPRAKRAK